jgi:hypothetical protein
MNKFYQRLIITGASLITRAFVLLRIVISAFVLLVTVNIAYVSFSALGIIPRLTVTQEQVKNEVILMGSSIFVWLVISVIGMVFLILGAILFVIFVIFKLRANSK